MIFQHYIHNPLLIYKKKFDLRMYVLISNVDPLIVYLHKEGFYSFHYIIFRTWKILYLGILRTYFLKFQKHLYASD